MINRRLKMKSSRRVLKRNNKLQENYKLTIQLGMILSLSISLVLFKMDYRPSQEKEVVAVAEQEEVFMEEVIQTKQEIKAPAPPRPVIPIEVPNDEIIEDDIIELDAELDLGEVFDVPLPPRPQEDVVEEEEEIFVVVEQPPVLIGGIESVQKLIVYPPLAQSAGIEGRVIVQFVIDSDGNVVDPFIVRGIGGGCDEEALRAVKHAKFRPGMQRGRAVSVRYTLPVTFKLKKSVNS